MEAHKTFDAYILAHLNEPSVMGLPSCGASLQFSKEERGLAQRGLLFELMTLLGEKVKRQTLLEKQRELGIGKNHIAALRDGNVCVDFLTSTNGGDMLLGHAFNAVFAPIIARGGLVRSFAGNRAFSLGAMTWMAAQERYGLGCTQWLWHLPWPRGAPLRPSILTEAKKQFQPAIRFFRENGNGEDWARQLDTMNSPDDQLVLGAPALQERGFLSAAPFLDHLEMLEYLEARTPWRFSVGNSFDLLGPELAHECFDGLRGRGTLI